MFKNFVSFVFGLLSLRKPCAFMIKTGAPLCNLYNAKTIFFSQTQMNSGLRKIIADEMIRKM